VRLVGYLKRKLEAVFVA